MATDSGIVESSPERFSINWMLFNSSRLLKASWFYSLLVLAVNIAFILFGTVIFMLFENKGAIEELEHRLENKEHLFEHVNESHFILAEGETHENRTMAILSEVLRLQSQMCRKNNVRGDDAWDFWGSFSYCNTVITTLGYGMVYPHTVEAQLISIVYAIIGIPVYTAYVTCMAYYINSWCDFVFDKIEIKCKAFKMSPVKRLVTKVAVVNGLLCTYIMINAFVITPPVMQSEHTAKLVHTESYLDMIYWQVIRFTTIGFGDVVKDSTNEVNCLLVTMFLIPFGISITTFYFQIFRKLCGKRTKRVMGKFAPSKVNFKVDKVFKTQGIEQDDAYKEDRSDSVRCGPTHGMENSYNEFVAKENTLVYRTIG